MLDTSGNRCDHGNAGIARDPGVLMSKRASLAVPIQTGDDPSSSGEPAHHQGGPVALVSGTSSGIGRACAIALLDAMTRALAIDEARNGVRVNAVCPGAIRTPLAMRLNTESEFGTIARWSWGSRLGTPEEVADVALFLVSGATFVTGQTISVPGGAELGYGVKGPLKCEHS